MGNVEDILGEYTRMRENGLEAKQILQALRPHIELLNKEQRDDLAGRVRTWEGKGQGTRSAEKPATNPAIKLIKRLPTNPAASAPAPTSINAESATAVVSCPKCGKANQRIEIFCYGCGTLLEPMRGANETRNLTDPAPRQISSEYFGPDSVLALRLRGSADMYEVRPQDIDHEVLVGRSTSGSAMMPDIDLADRHGESLGVSRLHMGIRYDGEQNALMVSDLGSANGSFINGQRLMAKEIRVLRHGDELRLGHLVLKVSFRHPKAQPD